MTRLRIATALPLAAVLFAAPPVGDDFEWPRETGDGPSADWSTVESSVWVDCEFTIHRREVVQEWGWVGERPVLVDERVVVSEEWSTPEGVAAAGLEVPLGCLVDEPAVVEPAPDPVAEPASVLVDADGAPVPSHREVFEQDNPGAVWSPVENG